MRKTHYVNVSVPEIGSHFYALMYNGTYPAIYFVAVKDGRCAFTEERRSFEHMIQGKVPDEMGNHEVIHGYLEGKVTVLPQTNKVWSFNNRTIVGSVPPTIKKELIYDGWAHLTITSSQLISDGDNTTSISSSDRVYTYSWTNTDGRWQDVRVDVDFIPDYANLRNSKVNITHYTTGRNYAGRPYETTNLYTGSCQVADLGIVKAIPYNWYGFDAECQQLLDMSPPSTFLVDLYEKLGTPNVNNYGNIAALKKYKQMIPPILNLIKKRNIKSISDLYLWWKYSYSTTKMDIEAYVEFFKSLARQKEDPTNASHYSLSYRLAYNDVLRYNVYLSPFSIGVMEALGLDINFVNTWDLIPFSFVVDWFISLEDTLHSLDVADLESRVKLKSLLSSRKRTRVFHPNQFCFLSGDISSVQYRRSIDNRLPKVVCDVHFNNPSSHLLDGISLIVSCKK